MTDYHRRTDSVSKTMLAHFHRSPCEYERYFVSKVCPPPRPKAVVVGAAAHAILLEGCDIDDILKVYPANCLKNNGAINPTPARKFEASLGVEQFAVKEPVREQVQSLLNGIANHEVVSLIASATSREQAIYDVDPDTNLDVRIRPDFYHDMGNETVCYDLKFTSQILPSDFYRTARTLKYWMQDAHYSMVLERKLEKPCRFVFWAVEDTLPFRIARHEYTQDSREQSRMEVGATLARLAECHKTGDWSDDWTKRTNDLFFTHTEAAEEQLDWSE